MNKMKEENAIRKRNKHTNEINSKASAKHEKDKVNNNNSEFIQRESPLTVLLENSLHIRAIYHIFVVILLILFFDTIVYDLVERGKINIGLNVVINGFGEINRGVKLWLFQFMVALTFYPSLNLYALGAKSLRKNKAALRLWKIVGAIGLAALQAGLIAVPVLDLSSRHLALASSITVTCEMFRLVMKIHAVAMASAPRCHRGDAPLPTFKQYLYFLFAPTLVYRDEYPRTKKIRWGVVIFHFSEVAAIIFYNSFLWERFILPNWSNYGKEPRVEAGTVARAMFACILPGVISFLCGFYCLLHAWLNAFAEILKFGDRLFYEEWWTSSHFSRYYRAWNRVVHSWLRDHIYQPLAPRAGRVYATLIVFVVNITIYKISAVVHEVIIGLAMGFFYPVLMTEFGVVGLLMLPLTAYSGRRFPSMFNVFMWLSFFLGNGLLWSLYPMEYFARKNCPPSPNDNFFIPKSWSCPEIVLKPNWTFQNPLDIIFY